MSDVRCGDCRLLLQRAGWRLRCETLERKSREEFVVEVLVEERAVDIEELQARDTPRKCERIVVQQGLVIVISLRYLRPRRARLPLRSAARVREL